VRSATGGVRPATDSSEPALPLRSARGCVSARECPMRSWIYSPEGSGSATVFRPGRAKRAPAWPGSRSRSPSIGAKSRRGSRTCQPPRPPRLAVAQPALRTLRHGSSRRRWLSGACAWQSVSTRLRYPRAPVAAALRAAGLMTNSPFSTRTSTVCPGLNSPASSFIASGFWSLRWMVRLSGRAPRCGS